MLATTLSAATMAKEPAPATAATRWVEGIDVASWQHPDGAAIDWKAVARSGKRYAWIKATDGTNYTNPWYATDVAGATHAGMYRGGYHYARPGRPVLDTARNQAAHFASVLGNQWRPGTLPPVLDLEDHGGLNRRELAQWAQAFLQELQSRVGRVPMIYTGWWFWDTFVGDANFSSYPLWLANYTSGPAPTGTPVGWRFWTVWQWSSTTTVPGIRGNVDANRLIGGEAALANLAAGKFGNNPRGDFNGIEASGPNKVYVHGWAYDPDVPSERIPVHVYVDAAGTALETDQHRTDVNQVNGIGGDHGWGAHLDAAPGSRVCAYAIDATGQGPTRLACQRPPSWPKGRVVAATSPAGHTVVVSGWAIDPNSDAPIEVHAYVDGVGVATVANLAAALPPPYATGFSGSHGFSVAVPAEPGRRTVCTAAINRAGTPGSNTWIDCQAVTVRDGSPRGSVASASSYGPLQLRIKGSASDPDMVGPIPVHVYVDDRGTATMSSAGGAFDVSVPVGPGAHRVCVAAINATGTPGEDRWLECRTVDVPSGPPTGTVDAVVREAGGLRVRGWALDPDDDRSIDVHVYVATAGTSVVAAAPRPDVAASQGWGPAHGFDVVVPAGPAPQRVCVAAINSPGTPGGDRWLDCRDA